MARSGPVHRNLLDYEKKVGRSLTVRMAACTAAALACGLTAGGLLWFGLRVPWAASQFAVLAVTVPLWALGFARPCGMKPERWWPYGRRTLFGATRLEYATGDRVPSVPRAQGMGGAWDVLQKRWESGGRRRRGVELWDPSKAR